jgi:hypothetical protein
MDASAIFNHGQMNASCHVTGSAFYGGFEKGWPKYSDYPFLPKLQSVSVRLDIYGLM